MCLLSSSLILLLVWTNNFLSELCFEVSVLAHHVFWVVLGLSRFTLLDTDDAELVYSGVRMLLAHQSML